MTPSDEVAGAEGNHPICTSEARKIGDTAPDGSTYLAGARARPLANLLRIEDRC